MSSPERATRAALGTTRDRTVETLCRQFAADSLTLAEFERRVDRAHGATSVSELRELVVDLPALADASAGGPGSAADDVGDVVGGAVAASDAAGADSPATTGASGRPAKRDRTGDADRGRNTRVLLALMGGVERSGRWSPPTHLVVTALMGGAELDFREARLPPGTTRVTIACVMGGVEIIVPPDLAVDTSGVAIMGGFEHRDSGLSPSDAAPRLELNGIALMGAVEVEVRRRGETAKEAKRRRLRE